MIKKTLLSLSLAILAAPAMADWPVALTDNFTVHQSHPTTNLDLLKNDIGNNLKVVSVNDWSENGARIRLINNDPVQIPSVQGYVYGDVTYQPNPNFVGLDGFWYVIEDDQGRKNAIRVVVEVKAESSALPNPQWDFFEIPKNAPTRINVLANDLFTNMSASIGDTFRGKIADFNTVSAKGGTVEKIEVYPADYLQIGGSQNGQFFVENTFKYQFKYTPPTDFVGTDSFTYAIKDSLDGSNNEVNSTTKWTKVSLNVTAGDTKGPWPEAISDETTLTFNQYVSEGAIDVLKNDTGKNLLINLSSAYSQNGARVEVVPNHPNRPYIKYSGGATGVDRVWYNIEDEYGRKNFSFVDVTKASAQ